MEYDIRESVLEAGKRAAKESGVDERCSFSANPPEPSSVDIVISVDAFEHFADPENVLNVITNALRPGGRLITSFGPTWYHPNGGHLLSVFPWAHLLFSESALCRWRADFKDDVAKRFCEVEGGLNQMTISRFEGIVRDSPLKVQKFDCRPISRLRAFQGRWTRELLTSVVDCVLKK